LPSKAKRVICINQSDKWPLLLKIRPELPKGNGIFELGIAIVLADKKKAEEGYNHTASFRAAVSAPQSRKIDTNFFFNFSLLHYA
jgi:hypothetical protein